MRYAVYQLRKHPNNSHFHAVTTAEGLPTGRIIFDGTSKLSDWVPLKVKLVGNELPPAEVSTIYGPSALVVSADARQQLAMIFDQGIYEFLPLDCEDRTFFIVNVLEIVDCLRADKANLNAHIPKYDFNPSKFGPSIFKIPEDAAGPMLILEDQKNVEKSLIYQIETLRIPGLRFDLVWEGNDKRQLTDRKPVREPKIELPVPGAVRIVRVGPNEVVIGWDQLPGIKTYTVQWSKYFNTGYVSVGTADADGNGATEVAFTDSHPEGDLCFYRVISHGEGRNRSRPSEPVEVTIGDPNGSNS